MPPVTSKSSVAVPAVSTITTTVPGTVPAVVPEFWRAPAGTTTPAVAPAVKKNPAVNAALVKARAVGKDTVETPLDLLKKVSSFQNTPARRKKPAASSPVVSTGATPVYPAETRAKVSARALGVFPPKTQAVVPSVQTTPAIVSSGAPAVFPAEAPSVQTTPTLVSAGAPAGTRAKFSARYSGVFPAETRAKAPSVHTTPTIVSAAVEDELMRRNSISAESSRRSRTLNRSNFDDRRLRSRSRSDYSDGDWLVHKKRRRTSPVKVKQEPTGGDENDVDMKSETRGTDAATVDDSGHDNSNNHNSDSCPVKIKEEPGGSDEKYVDMNSKNNDKRINESNNNDNVYTEDWFARVLSRYPPSSFLRSTSTSPSTYPSSLFGHGEKSCSDKGRRHHQKRHHRSESKGEDSPAAKRKKKKKKKDRESPPVKVKQEPAWW